LAFVLIEMFRKGKRVNLDFEANVHKWGMIVLLVLIALITVKDIAQVFMR
jgi:hypothetical protein